MFGAYGHRNMTRENGTKRGASRNRLYMTQPRIPNRNIPPVDSQRNKRSQTNQIWRTCGTKYQACGGNIIRPPSCPSSSCLHHRNRSQWVVTGGAQPSVSKTLPCPIQNQPGRACRARHRPTGRQRHVQLGLQDFKRLGTCKTTHSLLVCLVNGIQCILDGDTLQVSGCDFHAQWKVQVDLFNGRFRQRQLQDSWVFYCC